MKRQVSNEELSAYYDGEAAHGHQVANSLREDAATQRLFQQYSAVSAHLKALPEPAVRQDFAGDVIRAIHARQERRAISWWSSVMAPVATAAAFVLFAGFAAIAIVGTSSKSTVPTSSTVAQNSPAPAPEIGLASVVRATYEADDSSDIAFASDSNWLFSEPPASTTESLGAKADQIITALAKVEYFDRPVSPPLASGSDMRATLTGMNDNTQRTFVRLLNDYAYESE